MYQGVVDLEKLDVVGLFTNASGTKGSLRAFADTILDRKTVAKGQADAGSYNLRYGQLPALVIDLDHPSISLCKQA